MIASTEGGRFLYIGIFFYLTAAVARINFLLLIPAADTKRFLDKRFKSTISIASYSTTRLSKSST
jgi:hypothetical protein